jgi:hypothetical protein
MGLHKGARIEGADYFDDFGEQFKDDGGILKGLGQNFHEGVREELTPTGLKVSLSCRMCGRENPVLVDWEELFYIGSNGPGMSPLLPKDWAYSEENQAVYPTNILCRGKCQGTPVAPMITPDEAQEYFGQGLSQGFVTPQSAQAWKRQVALYRQQHG